MALLDKIQKDLQDAMKAGDRTRLDVLRMLKAQLKNAEIEKGGPLSEEEELQALSTAIKRRRESMELYEKGGRTDLYEKEAREIEIIQSYMPKPLSDEELEEVVAKTIAEVGATSPRDMGKVMKEIMSRYRGRVDGKKVQNLVREKLSEL
ncbi:MAG TPA: GatB/YqeY domain-containing protein [Bacteroidetes bacterium]|nr:GatB/YqeY domain-containing protein [Bacteroidota bacterium]